MAKEDNNVQDISVHDKDVAALPPTHEGQDIDSTPRNIVPMPAYTDPNNPLAASGSVNMALDEHPVTHSEDYGQYERDLGDHPVTSPLDTHAREVVGLVDGTEADEDDDTPEDRADWKKADWQKQAREYGLATSGNLGTVQGRVEDHESAVEERDTYEKDVNGKSREELDKLAAEFDIDPATYTHKEDLAAAIIAAEYDEDVPPGDKAPAENA